jgi:cellulose synthase (UDP-forming)
LLTGLHIPAIALICGAILFVCLFNSRQKWPRILMCLLSAASAAIYLDWRLKGLLGSSVGNAQETSVGETIWRGLFLGVELLCLYELAVFLLLMSRTSDHSGSADRHERMLRAVNPADLPDIDVWIATYDEEWSILEKTVIGALNLDYPKDKLRVYVLDDGRRPWLRERCDEVGAIHITRPDNKGKKAGNHNHALKVTSAPFIVSLDADFVPYPNFILRILGFFEDPKTAIVQTPQTYFNIDVIRSGLGLGRTAPDDLAYFYREIQPARDAWGAAFYCGSCAVLRRSALLKIGGFETKTDVEDQATSVRLLADGYVTRFLNEQLSVGLSAESLAVLHDQRNRWCRGSIQIVFLNYGPFGRGLKLFPRMLFSQTTWVTWSLAPLVFTFSPMFQWMFGWKLYPGMTAVEVLAVPGGLFIALSVAMMWISRLHWNPISGAASNLFMAIELLPTALCSFIKPFGKPLIRILPVTPKGANAAIRWVDNPTFTFLAACTGLLLVTFVYAVFIENSGLYHPDEIIASVSWTLYTLVVLAIAMLTCFEKSYRRDEERFAVEQPVSLSAKGRVAGALLLDISISGALIRADRTLPLSVGDTFELTIPGFEPITGAVVRMDQGPHDFGVKFDPLEQDIRHRLILALFTNADLQAQPESFSWKPVIGGLLRRFLGTT